MADRHSWLLVSNQERSGLPYSLASSQGRKMNMPYLQLAIPGKREHHGPVAANDRHGTGFGSSLISIRTDTRLSDVEAYRRRIIIDLSGSSRAGLPQPVLRRNQSLEPAGQVRSVILLGRTTATAASGCPRVSPRVACAFRARPGIVPMVLIIQL
jgi:hypothetical protein